MSDRKRGRRNVLPVRSTRVCRVERRNGLVVATLVVETGPTSDPLVAAAFREIVMVVDLSGGVVIEPHPEAVPPAVSAHFGTEPTAGAAWSLDLPGGTVGDREKLAALVASGALVLTPAPAAVDAENTLRTPSIIFEVDVGPIRAFLEAVS